MAILCSQCGAHVPRPDVTRTPIVCPRCATLKSVVDDDDMPTMDQPPPARAQKPLPAAGRPAAPPSVPAPPKPSVPPRASVRPPVVGGPPGSRIRAGESPASRPSPSVAPRPMSVPPAAGGPPRPSNAPAPRPSAAPPASSRAAPRPSVPPTSVRPAAAPIPRAAPLPKVGRAIPVTEDSDTNEFSPIDESELDEASGDINLATGDFESIDNLKKPGPPRP